MKCCSNGCGTTCTDPELKTVCDHLRGIGEHQAREKGIPPKQMFIFSCLPDGSFNPIQCLPNKTCWCVDDSGVEVPATRLHGRQPKNCPEESRECPVLDCDMECDNGIQLDGNGCPTCYCRDPCDGVLCLKSQECREVEIHCIDGPCPPIAMCLPKLQNPCGNGQPLRDLESDDIIRCGVEGSACPSTHKCHLSPLGEFAVCCPKPSDVCELPEDSGRCLAAFPRWFFNVKSNSCEKFVFGGCGGNSNNFLTKRDCETACPVLSTCERTREKNTQLTNAYGRHIFIPKCNSRTGNWEPMQCLPSLGLCWCVNKDGEQIPGTLLRGVPKCTARTGRQYDQINMTSACEKDKALHVCNPYLCDNKICLRQPDALCRVDPCGGCSLKFYDNDGMLVNCTEGLTSCQLEMQTVMNSKAWANQENPLAQTLVDEEVQFELVIAEETRVKRDLEGDADSSPAQSSEYPDGSASSPPLKEEEAALLVGTIVPQCTNKGAYSPTQNTGTYSWCVTPDGEPIQSTLSKGNIQCSPRGEIISREEDDEEVCPQKSLKPRICKNECLDVYCSSHPDAICVADPCDNCKLSFFSLSGNLVSCEPKCSQPKSSGECRASFRRFFYNESAQQCQEFVYGGCGGNDNNFHSAEECMNECSKPVDICELPKRIGMCRASMRRWFFNQLTHQCEKFIFGGCDGNDNNFETKEECEARCPDLVLCPTINLIDMQKPCSRNAVCNGITCEARVDLICTVDPCNNCSAIFVDLDGHPAVCEMEVSTPEDMEGTSTREPVPVPEVPDYPITRKTRCQKEQALAQAWVQRQPSCDKKGQYTPMQCIEKNSLEKEVCWCVDEAGNRIRDSENFVKGTQSCKLRLISFVQVTLVFQHDKKDDLSDHVLQFRKAVNDVLEAEGATTTDEIAVTFTPETVIVKFVLVGDRKIDAAFTLEEMVKYGMLKLVIADKNLKAVPEGSAFYHSLSSDSEDFDQSLWLSATAIGAILIFSFLTIVLVCALIGGVMVYRKRRMGTYPRGSLESLASSTSPLYAYETKIPPPHVSCIEHDYAILSVLPEKKTPLV